MLDPYLKAADEDEHDEYGRGLVVKNGYRNSHEEPCATSWSSCAGLRVSTTGRTLTVSDQPTQLP